MSSNLSLQKRLAADVMGCGKRKVWMDPMEMVEIGNAHSREGIRTLIKNGLIIKRLPAMHSRARARQRALEKRKGRHKGPGKRRGTKEARMPSKLLWIQRMRTLRALLKNCRSNGKIDRHLHHELYMKVKGNMFRSKRVLIEHIEKIRKDKERAKMVGDQMEALKLQRQMEREKKSQKGSKRQ